MPAAPASLANADLWEAKRIIDEPPRLPTDERTHAFPTTMDSRAVPWWRNTRESPAEARMGRKGILRGDTHVVFRRRHRRQGRREPRVTRSGGKLHPRGHLVERSAVRVGQTDE